MTVTAAGSRKRRKMEAGRGKSSNGNEECIQLKRLDVIAL
jgi:hypothetical protein